MGNNQNPWLQLVALMLLPAMGGINDPRIRSLLDTVTQNDDGSFNTEQFVTGMIEILKEETESLSIEEVIEKLKGQNTNSNP